MLNLYVLNRHVGRHRKTAATVPNGVRLGVSKLGLLKLSIIALVCHALVSCGQVVPNSEKGPPPRAVEVPKSPATSSRSFTSISAVLDTIDFSSLPPVDAPDLQVQRFIRDFNKAINSSQPRYVTAVYVVEEVAEEDTHYFIGGQLLMLGECIAALKNGDTFDVLGVLNMRGRTLQVCSDYWLPSAGLRFPKTDTASEKTIITLRKGQSFLVDIPLYVALDKLERIRFARILETDEGKAAYPTRVRPWAGHMPWPPKFFAGITQYPDSRASISDRKRDSWFRRDISKMTYMKNPGGTLYLFDTRWITAPDRLPYFAKWLQQWEWRGSAGAPDRITNSRNILAAELKLLHDLPGEPGRLPASKELELLRFYQNPFIWKSDAQINRELEASAEGMAKEFERQQKLQQARWIVPASWKNQSDRAGVTVFTTQEDWVTVLIRSVDRSRFRPDKLREMIPERIGTNYTFSSSLDRQTHGKFKYDILTERAITSKSHNNPSDNTRMVAVLDLKENSSLIWMFEITGRSQSIAEAIPDFRRFLASVTFP